MLLQSTPSDCGHTLPSIRRRKGSATQGLFSQYLCQDHSLHSQGMGDMACTVSGDGLLNCTQERLDYVMSEIVLELAGKGRISYHPEVACLKS